MATTTPNWKPEILFLEVNEPEKEEWSPCVSMREVCMLISLSYNDCDWLRDLILYSLVIILQELEMEARNVSSVIYGQQLLDNPQTYY